LRDLFDRSPTVEARSQRDGMPNQRKHFGAAFSAKFRQVAASSIETKQTNRSMEQRRMLKEKRRGCVGLRRLHAVSLSRTPNLDRDFYWRLADSNEGCLV
jgi:hypothetical protein